MKQNAGILFHGSTMEMSRRTAYDREGRRKYLTRTEGLKFLEQSVQLSKSDALFCLFLYYTGCRISEALGLCRDDLDSEMDVVLIRSLKKRGKNEIRRIPIPDFLAKELRSAPVQEIDPHFWCFSRATGWRTIKAVMKGAGISGVHATTKGLRHGFGVRGVLEKLPLTLIQRWMGHSDLGTTAIYLAVQDEEERTLIKRMW